MTLAYSLETNSMGMVFYPGKVNLELYLGIQYLERITMFMLLVITYGMKISGHCLKVFSHVISTAFYFSMLFIPSDFIDFCMNDLYKMGFVKKDFHNGKVPFGFNEDARRHILALGVTGWPRLHSRCPLNSYYCPLILPSPRGGFHAYKIHYLRFVFIPLPVNSSSMVFINILPVPILLSPLNDGESPIGRYRFLHSAELYS